MIGTYKGWKFRIEKLPREANLKGYNVYEGYISEVGSLGKINARSMAAAVREVKREIDELEKFRR